MKSLQKIAEQLILALYQIQRKKGFISNDVLEFTTFTGSNNLFVSISDNLGVGYHDDQLEKMFLKISNESEADLLNALEYLQGKGLITFHSAGNTYTGLTIRNIKLTAPGVDIIEGVSGAETKKKEYQITFNVKLADKINIDSLVKTELGSILKLI